MPTVAGAMMSLILVWVCVSREGSLGPGMGPSAQRSSGTSIPVLVSVDVWLHQTCDFTEGSCDFAWNHQIGYMFIFMGEPCDFA